MSEFFVSRSATTLLCFLICGIESVFSTATFPCKWNDPALNSSFDLCELRLSNETQNQFYKVHDKRATPNVTSFEYFFNVASDLAANMPESSCYNLTQRVQMSKPLGYCDKINGTECIGKIVNITANTGGYQGYKSHNSCFRLHDGVTQPSWSLINSEDPTKGVQLTYTNGDWCKAGGKNRELTLVFNCDNDYSNRFDREERIEEFETCSYAVELYTIHGCPLGCPYVDQELCNGQGVCEFDYSNNRSKCFCYEGYYGAECADTEDPNKEVIYDDDDEQYVGGLIIVVILLVVMLAILTYLWLRLSNANKGIIKSDIVKRLVKKRSGAGAAGAGGAGASSIAPGRSGAGQQLQSIDKDDSYDDDERVAV